MAHLCDVESPIGPVPAPTAVSRQRLRALVVANALSLTGNVVMTVAIPWLVLTATGSAAVTGLVVFTGAGGALAGGLIAGRVVDSIGPVRASTVADLLSGLAVVPLPILWVTSALETWQVVVLVAAGTLVDSTGSTARQAMVPLIATADGQPRERANAMFTSAEHAGYLLGAPLSGVLIAGLGAGGALAVAIALFVTAAGLVARFVELDLARTVDSTPERTGLATVIRFIWADRALRALVVFPTLAVLIVGPLVPIVLPVLARQVFDDPIVLGLMVASYGVGGLLGTAGYGVFGGRIPRRRLYRTIFVVWPSAFAAIAVFTSLTLTLTMLLVIGIAAGALVPLQATIRQERAPAELLARVVGLSTASIPVAAPIGVVVTGALIDVAGLRHALVLLSAGAALIGALALVSRATSQLDSPENAEGAYR